MQFMLWLLFQIDWLVGGFAVSAVFQPKNLNQSTNQSKIMTITSLVLLFTFWRMCFAHKVFLVLLLTI